MRGPEYNVRQRGVRICRDAGCYVVPVVAGSMTPAGTPDTLVCYRGRFIAIEYKAGQNRPTPIQRRRLRECLLAGGIPMVVNERNLGDLVRYFETGGLPGVDVMDRLVFKEVSK
jgi:hypothetical protein